MSTCTCTCGLESNKTSSYFLTTMSGWFPGLQGFSKASALWIQVLLSLVFSHFVPRVDFLISMAFLMAYFHLFFFSGNSSQDVPHKLAISLHLLLKNCFPTRLKIFSMADHVMQRLQHEDEELYNHLTSETLKNLSSNPREFLVNFIHTEKEKAMLAERQAVGRSFESLPSDAKELLSHPVMFIRKWIAEVCKECLVLTLYTWRSVYMFSILFSIHYLRC